MTDLHTQSPPDNKSLSISQEDLKAAVTANVISERDADQLRAFVERRALGQSPEDERFRVVAGMNDVFIALGIVLLFIPMFILSMGWGGSETADWATWINFLSAAIFWGLAEAVIRRRRTTFPGFFLAAGFSSFMFIGGLALFTQYNSAIEIENLLTVHTLGWIGVSVSGLALFSIGLFEWRFKLPFCRIFSALSGLVVILSLLVAIGLGDILDVRWTAFTFGAGLFTWAVWLDSTDTKRITLRSDRAFWLHVCAAPMLAHPLMTYATDLGSATTIASFSILALLAIIIDRRAPLVSSLAYFGYWVGQRYTSLGADDFSTFLLTFVSLGLLVLFLGVGWRQVRRFVVSPIKNAAVFRYLPEIR